MKEKLQVFFDPVYLPAEEGGRARYVDFDDLPPKDKFETGFWASIEIEKGRFDLFRVMIYAGFGEIKGDQCFIFETFDPEVVKKEILGFVEESRAEDEKTTIENLSKKMMWEHEDEKLVKVVNGELIEVTEE